MGKESRGSDVCKTCKYTWNGWKKAVSSSFKPKEAYG